MKNEFPQIQPDVPGPDGQSGFLLIVPRDEVLDWDIRNEIVSTSRYWMQDRQAWWVAAAYLHTAEEIVVRFARAAAQSPPAGPSSPPPSPPAPQVAQDAPPAPAQGRFGRAARALRSLIDSVLRRGWRAPRSADSA